MKLLTRNTCLFWLQIQLFFNQISSQNSKTVSVQEDKTSSQAKKLATAETSKNPDNQNPKSKTALTAENNYGYDNLPLYSKKNTNLITKIHSILGNNGYYLSEPKQEAPYVGYDIADKLGIKISKNYFNKMIKLNPAQTYKKLKNSYNSKLFYYLGKITNPENGNCDVWYHIGEELTDDTRVSQAKQMDTYNYFNNYDLERDINASSLLNAGYGPTASSVGNFNFGKLAVKVANEALKSDIDLKKSNLSSISKPTASTVNLTNLKEFMTVDYETVPTPISENTLYSTKSPFYSKPMNNFKSTYYGEGFAWA